MQKCISPREEFYIKPFIECKDTNINEHVTYHDMLHFNRTMYLKHLHWKAKRGNANVKEVFSFPNRPRRRRSLWSLSKVGSNYALICTRGKSGQSVIGGKTWQKTTNFGIEAQVVVLRLVCGGIKSSTCVRSPKQPEGKTNRIGVWALLRTKCFLGLACEPFRGQSVSLDTWHEQATSHKSSCFRGCNCAQ